MSAISSMVAQAGQTFLSAYALKEQGKQNVLTAQRKAAEKEFEAQQLESNAGQVIAAAQRARFEVERQSTLIASRAVAVAAASGGGASDQTVVSLLGRVKAEGTYRGALALYQGEEKARQMVIAARVRRYEGAVGEDIAYRERKLGNELAWANLGIGAGSISSKYSGGGYQSGSGNTMKSSDEFGGNSGWAGQDSGGGNTATV